MISVENMSGTGKQRGSRKPEPTYRWSQQYRGAHRLPLAIKRALRLVLTQPGTPSESRSKSSVSQLVAGLVSAMDRPAGWSVMFTSGFRPFFYYY